MSYLADKPAFPSLNHTDKYGEIIHRGGFGMTFRQYAAVQIMAGLVSDSTMNEALGSDIVDFAVRLADALVGELGK